MSQTPPSSSSPRVKELFARASELPPDQRAAFLEAECAGDTALRAAVESLLTAHDEAGGFLAGPTMEPRDELAAPLPEERQIGPYKLLQIIGEGGFGTVYLAEQLQPVNRRVALKIIKPGMDTRQVIARFEAERQALALMDHPNIARVFDGGATSAGRPYFVMELVSGEPITKYCDDRRLTPRQRLELFVAVCQAVQHAHQKGIIHRDIKPGNVLVTVHDGKPVPKVIDFGIAKATQSRLTEKTLFTEFKQLIGTPEYMSPEQAEMSGLDIDTRSDVYSLGVLLYELLVGATPFDARELRSKAYGELQRVIREVDPPRPSTRLSTLQTLPNVAAQRSTEPAKLGALIRGELDWIVMKCLEKDRTRRYETASALAVDIAHHLADEPVSASPASTTYRVRKFARRHRVGLAFATSLLLVLCIGLALAIYGLNRARVELHRAEAARAAEAEARAYEKETDRFLTGMFNFIDPAESRGKDVLVKDVLEAVSKQLDTDPPKYPTAEASVRYIIGDAYNRLGLPAKAIHELKRAVELENQAHGPIHRNVAHSLHELGKGYVADGQFELANTTLRRAIDAFEKTLGPNHAETISAEQDLIGLLIGNHKLEEADTMLTAVLQRQQNNPATDPMDLASTQNLLSSLKAQRGQYVDAEPLARAAMETSRKAQGADHPDTIVLMNNLAENLRNEGKLVEAESVGDEAYRTALRVLGPTHQVTLRLGNTQALRLQAVGKFDEAAKLYAETITRMKAALGEDNPRTLLTRSNAALVLQDQERFPEALAEFRDVAERMRRVSGEKDANTLIAEHEVAVTLAKMGRYAEAEPLMREQLPRIRAVFGERHPTVYMAMMRLGAILDEQGKHDQAEPLLAEAYTAANAAKAPNLGYFAASYGICLTHLGKDAQAIPLLLDAERFATRLPHLDAKGYAKLLDGLITAYQRSGNQSEADRWRTQRDRPPQTQPATSPATTRAARAATTGTADGL